MKKRILGLDLARAFAVIGMIVVNFKVVFGEQGDSWLKMVAHLFEGKAAATFVVLAGVGLALMTNSAVQTQNQEKLKIAQRQILKRSFFLFFVGISYIWIWVADILHFYGIYMLVTLLFISRKPNEILIGAGILIFIYPILGQIWDYEADWNLTTLEYKGLWTFEGFLKNLFYNGFHPAIPWMAFMLIGLWFGKQDLNDSKFVCKTLKISFLSFISIQIFSKTSLILLAESDNIETLTNYLGTNPMPPMPLYMFNGISIALTIISGCILLGKRFENSFIIDALNKTGQLALTFYVAHVILGMGIVEDLDPTKLGHYSIEFSVIYALIFSLLCVLFAVIWLRFKKMGPLEWGMRKLTS